MTIAVVFGGPSPEHDISILTGLQAARALHDAGRDVRCLYWTRAGRWRLVPPTSEAISFLEPDVPDSHEVELVVPGGFVERRRMRTVAIELDAVLNCCHGGPGEDGALSGLLRSAGLRVTGPSPAACAVVMDKMASEAIARAADVPTIESVLVMADGPVGELPQTPWVTKPRFGGSSIGVEAGIDDVDTVRALARSGVGRAGMVVQPFLKGWIDLNISVRTHPQFQVSAIERPLREGSDIYGYSDKYLTGGVGMDAAPRELPAVIPPPVERTIINTATRIAEVFSLSGAPRIDFLWDGSDSVVLCEINAIPGGWGNYLWLANGIPRTVLYDDLIDEAILANAALPHWSSTSDGRALQASGSIASKLA